MAKRPAKKASKPKSATADIKQFSKDEELQAYRAMLLIRRSVVHRNSARVRDDIGWLTTVLRRSRR